MFLHLFCVSLLRFSLRHVFVSSSSRACLSVVCELCFSEFLCSLILLLGFFFSLNYYNIFIILYWFLLFSFPPSFKFIIIINVCFRFFVFLASSCRGCLTILHDERTTTKKKKEEELGAKTLSLSLCSQNPNPPKERIVSRGAVFSLCAFGFGCECVCATSVRRRFWMLPGHGFVGCLCVCVCVCFCLKRALALSLSVRSHCLCLGLSRFLPFFSPLALSLSLISTSV